MLLVDKHAVVYGGSGSIGGAVAAAVERQVRTTFITARAAARRMTHGGVILFFGGEGDPPRGFSLGALQTGFAAVEAMRRQLAVELGPRGIRTVTIRTGGVPETVPERPEIAESTAAASPMGRVATLEDVGRVAAFI